MKLKDRLTEIGNPSNGARSTIAISQPYIAEVTIMGTSDMLFHRWDCDSIAEKASARKGSAAKKSDDLESFVYRNEKGILCVPGEYFRGAIVGAAKYKQDPRSTRKSAMELYKAGVIVLTVLAPLGLTKWDFEDRRRVAIQKNAITRTRPGIKAGWKATFELQVNLPEYIAEADLNEIIAMAGKLVGLADFRPTFGRFQITKFRVLE